MDLDELDELECEHPKYLLTTISIGIILELYGYFNSKSSSSLIINHQKKAYAMTIGSKTSYLSYINNLYNSNNNEPAKSIRFMEYESLSVFFNFGHHHQSVLSNSYLSSLQHP